MMSWSRCASDEASSAYVRPTSSTVLPMKTAAYHRDRRRPSVPRTSASQHVSDAAHRVQQLALERPIDLVPEPRDQHVDDVRARIEGVSPDVREDHRLREDLAGVAQQVLEERELARTELDGLAAPLHASAQEIHRKIRYREPC